MISNEFLFISFSIILASLGLFAFRLGKTYMFVLIAVYSVLMNIFVTKQFTLFGFDITGGNALYGAVFLLTDLLSEHYGKKEALRAVGTGFVTVLVFVVATQFLIAFEPNSFDFASESISTLFSLTPRILAGSLLAYMIAQPLDVFLFDKIKIWTKGRFLFLRNNGSTLVSQFVDSVIFTAVGLTSFAFLPFDGFIGVDIFWEVTLATYFIKVIFALIDTPFIYLSHLLKKPSK